MTGPLERRAKRRLDSATRKVARAQADTERARKLLVDALIEEADARREFEDARWSEKMPGHPRRGE